MRSERGRTDTASIVVAAEADAVYAAFATAEALIAWLPPGDMTARVIEYDFREGGRYRVQLNYPDGTPDGVAKTTERSDVSSGRFLDLEPGKRIVQSVEFETADASYAGEMSMTWSFEAVGPRTRVRVTAENVPPGISKADHDAGLRSSLENLARFVLARQRIRIDPSTDP